MLDDVAFGPFLEEPARKDAVPLVVALFLHRQLDKSPDFGRRFPRRCRIARAQPDDGAADPRGVAGAHFQIADQPVALVEQRDYGNAFGHRRRACNAAALVLHRAGAGDFGFNLGHDLAAAGAAITTRQHRDQYRASNSGPPHHPASGRQAS